MTTLTPNTKKPPHRLAPVEGVVPTSEEKNTMSMTDTAHAVNTETSDQQPRPLVFHRFTVLDVEAAIVSGRPAVALCGRRTSGSVTLPGDTVRGARPKSLCVTCEATHLLIGGAR